jgi:hypothetical protein
MPREGRGVNDALRENGNAPGCPPGHRRSSETMPTFPSDASPRGKEAAMSARLPILVIGAWLIVSTFLWDHTPAQMTNDQISGVLAIGFGALAMAMPAGRYLSALLGVWIFFSSWVVSTQSAGTVWTNVLCGIVIVFLSLIPTRERVRDDRLYARRRRHEVHA